MRSSCASLFIAFLITIVLAGCVEEPPTEPAPVVAPEFAYEDDRIKIQSTNATNAGWVPTLQEPPQWSVGEYWKVRLTDEFEGRTFEVYVVVAGQEDDFWLLGMPTHDFSNEIMIYHLPGLGQIKKDTLGFEAHDVWFDPVVFPLEEGKTWTTNLMNPNTDLTATVLTVDGLKAEIEVVGPTGPLGNGPRILITYDAEQRFITRLESVNYATYQVIEHGFDWHLVAPELDGVVTVPHMADLILCHGRVATVVQIDAEACGGFEPPAGASQVVEIDSTYDRVSASLILNADPFGTGLVPGTYLQVDATAPDGEVYSETLTAAEMVGVKLTSFKHDRPGGTWDVLAVAAGPSMAFVEGIGYHVYDVEIPSGHILPSIGEHQHGSAEGH